MWLHWLFYFPSAMWPSSCFNSLSFNLSALPHPPHLVIRKSACLFSGLPFLAIVGLSFLFVLYFWFFSCSHLMWTGVRLSNLYSWNKQHFVMAFNTFYIIIAIFSYLIFLLRTLHRCS
jgi:hypothetical protein